MAEEDPPPPRPRAPPALPDELVEEVLLRFPPDDPARLVHAALVCKRWARLVSSRAGAFRRRFRDFHLQRRGGAPMLGFIRNVPCAEEAFFVRTSASCPPLAVRRGWLALDARGGRVLLRRAAERVGRDGTASPGIRLAVWDPPLSAAAAAAGYLQLPIPILPRRPCFWNAALLCCDQDGLPVPDHAGGCFRVVLVGTGPEGTFACVYSSFGPAAWSEPIYTAEHHASGLGGAHVDAVRGTLVGNAFYFLFRGRTSILKHDLATGDTSVTPLPPASHNGWMERTVLTTTEDGGLGLARVEANKLCLWSMEPRPDDGALAMEWTRSRVIDIGSLLPVSDLIGFADGVGLILVGKMDGLFSVDQKSGRIEKLVDGPGFYAYVVPYVSFCTPALGTASTDEGPSGNA